MKSIDMKNKTCMKCGSGVYQSSCDMHPCVYCSSCDHEVSQYMRPAQYKNIVKRFTTSSKIELPKLQPINPNLPKLKNISIREGSTVKGGLNKYPITQSPPPPKSQGVTFHTTTDAGEVPMIINNGSTIVEYHDREQYEKDLKKKQEEHMKRVREFQEQQNPSYPTYEPPVEPWQPCLHDSCSECHGTGLKCDGSMCVHMISCTCPKCSTYC